MKVDVYQNLKKNNTMDNLDKYKGKWVKYVVFPRNSTPDYFLVDEIFKISDNHDYRLNSNFHFNEFACYGFGMFFNNHNLKDFSIVNESEVLEQAKKYGHKKIVEMLSKKEITKEDFHNCKIWIGDNPELSKKVQEKLFELGFRWASGSNCFDGLYSKVLFIYGNIGIQYSSYLNNLEQFKKYPEKEITPEQILAISLLEQEVLKKNTEVIVLKEKIETINQEIEEQKMSLDIDVQSLLNKRTEKLNLELKLEELTEEYKYALSSKTWLEEIVTEIFN